MCLQRATSSLPNLANLPYQPARCARDTRERSHLGHFWGGRRRQSLILQFHFRLSVPSRLSTFALRAAKKQQGPLRNKRRTGTSSGDTTRLDSTRSPRLASTAVLFWPTASSSQPKQTNQRIRTNKTKQNKTHSSGHRQRPAAHGCIVGRDPTEALVVFLLPSLARRERPAPHPRSPAAHPRSLIAEAFDWGAHSRRPRARFASSPSLSPKCWKTSTPLLQAQLARPSAAAQQRRLWWWRHWFC